MKVSISTERKVWVISDVHGCYNQLQQLIKKIELKSSDRLYLLGDCIDRGPKSKEVLDFAMTKPNVIMTVGNHEDMMLQTYQNEILINWWRSNGGKETLQSFGVQSIKRIPKKYILFLKSLPLYKRIKGFVLSHAGVNLYHSKPFRKTENNRDYILWNRKVKAPNESHGYRIVVGHTPKSMATIRKSAESTKVWIDGGCAYGGRLVAFCLNDNAIVSVKGLD